VAIATSPTTRSIQGTASTEQQQSFYGYGWAVDGEGVYSHGGSEGTYAWVDPSRQIVGLVLTRVSAGAIPCAVREGCGRRLPRQAVRRLRATLIPRTATANWNSSEAPQRHEERRDSFLCALRFFAL